jgi:phage terminase large subunit
MLPRITPSLKQHEAWEKLRDQVTENVLFGGSAGGGKSWLGSEWLLTNCYFYPHSRWFIGRDELKKIRQSTVVTIHKVLRHHKINPATFFKFNAQQNSFFFHNGSCIDLLECKYQPSDPLYERFGSLEYTGGWIEEAGEVAEDAATMISSRTGRHMNDRYGILGKTLITCNPKKNWLYYNYYIPHRDGRLPADKAFIKALVTDNPYGESGYVKKLDKLKGAMYMRLRKGIWEYDDDPAALIDTDAIGAIFEGFEWAKIGDNVLFFITVDPARKGKDSTTIGLWCGNNVKLFRYTKLLVTEVAMKVKELMNLYSVPPNRVVVDADGVGGGVVDILKCVQFVNNSRPLPAPINPLLDKEGNKLPENYDHLKSQCSFRTAGKINDGIIKVQIMKTEVVTTVEHEVQMLTEELEQVKQKKKSLDGDGKKAVVSKEDVKEAIGRSPDYWDCVMMKDYLDLKPKKSIFAA